MSNATDTLSHGYYKQMDGLRFISVFGVLFQHFIHEKVSHYFLSGNAGVDLFFIISGFLITENLLFLKSTHTIGKGLKVFYMRRVLRIFPLYYLYWGILILFFYSRVSGAISWGLLYGINFYSILHPVNKLYGHLWSLAVEEQFYILWPLIIFLVPRKYFLSAVSVLMCCSLGFMLYHFNSSSAIYNQVHIFGCAISLLTGALIAGMKKASPQALATALKNIRFAVLPALAIILLISTCTNLYILKPNYGIVIRLCMCIVGFFLVGKVATTPFVGRFGKFLQNKFVMSIGIISYGIYVWHYLVFVLSEWTVYRFTEKILASGLFNNSLLHYIRYNTSFVVFPVLVAMAIGIALASYYLFEQRFLRLKRYFV